MNWQIVNMTHIRQRYEELNPDGHWFDKSSMAFFGTVLPATGKRVGDVVLFLTSEKPPRGARAYSVRFFDWRTGDIGTRGSFCSFPDRKAAAEYMDAELREELDAYFGSVTREELERGF